MTLELSLDDILNHYEQSRLIPVTAPASALNACSTLLAVLCHVQGFCRRLLKPWGPKFSKSTRILSYTGIKFPVSGEQGPWVAEGIIKTQSGTQQWQALVLCRRGTDHISGQETQIYQALALTYGLDAVIIVSNQLQPVTSFGLKKHKASDIPCICWPWLYLLSEAKAYINTTPDLASSHAYLLEELIRFLQDRQTHLISDFHGMEHWPTLCSTILQSIPLDKVRFDVRSILQEWQLLALYLSFRLGILIGQSVQVIAPKYVKEQSIDIPSEDYQQFLAHPELNCWMALPYAVSPLKLWVDIEAHTLNASMQIATPQDRVKPGTLVNGLLSQLSNAFDPQLILVAKWPGKAAPTQTTLAALREDKHSFIPRQSPTMPKAVEIIKQWHINERMREVKAFVEDLESLLADFYLDVGQNLKAWAPSAHHGVKEVPVVKKMAEKKKSFAKSLFGKKQHEA